MSDIVQRLRNFAVWNNRQSHYEPVPLCQEAAGEIERLQGANKVMTKEQEEAVYSAYLSICRHRKYVVKWGPDNEVERVDKLLIEMGEAFPFIPARVACSALRIA